MYFSCIHLSHDICEILTLYILIILTQSVSSLEKLFLCKKVKKICGKLNTTHVQYINYYLIRVIRKGTKQIPSS